MYLDLKGRDMWVRVPFRENKPGLLQDFSVLPGRVFLEEGQGVIFGDLAAIVGDDGNGSEFENGMGRPFERVILGNTALIYSVLHERKQQLKV